MARASTALIAMIDRFCRFILHLLSVALMTCGPRYLALKAQMEPTRDPYLSQQTCRTAERHGRHPPRLHHPTMVRPERPRNRTGPFSHLDGSRRVVRHQNAAGDDDIQPPDPVDGYW